VHMGFVHCGETSTEAAQWGRYSSVVSCYEQIIFYYKDCPSLHLFWCPFLDMVGIWAQTFLYWNFGNQNGGWVMACFLAFPPCFFVLKRWWSNGHMLNLSPLFRYPPIPSTRDFQILSLLFVWYFIVVFFPVLDFCSRPLWLATLHLTFWT